MSWEKNVSTSSVRKSLCEAGPYGRTAAKKTLSMSKGSSGQRHTKTGQWSRGIK